MALYDHLNLLDPFICFHRTQYHFQGTCHISQLNIDIIVRLLSDFPIRLQTHGKDQICYVTVDLQV